MSKATFASTGRNIRGLTFLANGQRCETWLPKGEWHVVGECTVIDLTDSNKHIPALKLKHHKEGTWYVGRDAV